MTQLLSRFSSKIGDFDTDAVAIDLIGTVSEANKAIILFVEGRTQSTSGAQLTAITLDGVAGELFYNPAAAGHGGFAIAYWNEAQHPGTGTFDVQMTFDANLDSGNCLTLFELEDAPQTTAGFIHTFSNPVASVGPDATYDFSTTLNGGNGEFVIPYLAIADNSYWDPLLTDLSPNMTNIDFQDATRAMLYTWYGIGSGASEVFSGTYDHNRGGHSPESFHLGVLAIKAPAPPVNNDPTLDTPEPDFSISSDQSGVVAAVAGNISDADSDPITHSIVSGAPAGITMAANGDISANGSVAPGTYTITYQGDDLQGGTPAQDTFVLTVTAPTISIDSITAAPIRIADTINLGLSNASASGKALDIDGQEIADDSQDAAQISLTAPDPRTFGNKTLTFNADLTVTVTDGAESDSEVFQIAPAIGDFFDAVAELTGAWALPQFNGIAVGDEVYVERVSGDGDIDIALGVFGSGSAGSVYDITVRDLSDGIWGTTGRLTVPLADSDPPVITLVGSATVELDEGGTYVEQGATWTDALDGTGAANIGGDTVDANIPGTYIITYDYTDTSGNAAVQVTRTVIVRDITASVITLLGAGTITHPHGQPFVDPGATASDNSGGDISADINVSGLPNVNAVGTYIIRYNVSDAEGNVATEVTRTVNVIDQAAPILTLIGSATVNFAIGQVFVDPGVSSIDAVDGDISAFVVPTGSVNINAPGSYPIVYTSTDAAGNTAQVTRTVVVAPDVTAPVIALNGDAVVYHAQNTPYTDAGATVTDDVDDNLTPSIVTTGASFDFNVVGTYYVRYNVSDSSGNAANEVVRTVIVQDQTAPQILLNGSNMSIVQGDVFNDPGATASDNNDSSVQVVINGSVDTSTPGTYILTYDATDAAGNTAVQRTRTVTVTSSAVSADNPPMHIVKVMRGEGVYDSIPSRAVLIHDGRNIPVVPPKDPDAISSYGFDWNTWLPQGVQIINSVWMMDQEGLHSLPSEYNQGGITGIWWRNGNKDQTYKATNRITTDSGLVEDRSMLIECIEK